MGIRWERGCKMAAFCQVDVCGYLKHRASKLLPQPQLGFESFRKFLGGKPPKHQLEGGNCPLDPQKRWFEREPLQSQKPGVSGHPEILGLPVVQLVMGTRFQVANLVGDFNPYGKYYCSQIGSFPQVGIKKISTWNLKPPPRKALFVLGGGIEIGIFCSNHQVKRKRTPPNLEAKISQTFGNSKRKQKHTQPSRELTFGSHLFKPPTFLQLFLGQFLGPKKVPRLHQLLPQELCGSPTLLRTSPDVGYRRWVVEIPYLFKVLGIEITGWWLGRNPSENTWSQIGSWNPKWK